MWKFLVVCLSAISISVPMRTFHAQQLNSYRLPNSTTPQTYYINLDFSEFDGVNVEFMGNSLIVIKAEDDTSSIVLHSAVLISKVNLAKIVDGNEIEVTQNYDIDAVRQFLLVQATEETIRKDSILHLRIEFIGRISMEEEEGVFAKRYLKSEEEERRVGILEYFYIIFSENSVSLVRSRHFQFQ